MGVFVSALEAGWNFLMASSSQLFSMIMSVPMLIAVVALWVLDRIFGIFKMIKG